MSCALHKYGSRAAERIIEALDSQEMDMEMRVHLTDTARHIQILLNGVLDEITMSPHDEAELHDVSQSLDQALRAWGGVKELQQQAGRVIAIIDKIIAQVPA